MADNRKNLVNFVIDLRANINNFLIKIARRNASADNKQHYNKKVKYFIDKIKKAIGETESGRELWEKISHITSNMPGKWSLFNELRPLRLQLNTLLRKYPKKELTKSDYQEKAELKKIHINDTNQIRRLTQELEQKNRLTSVLNHSDYTLVDQVINLKLELETLYNKLVDITVIKNKLEGEILELKNVNQELIDAINEVKLEFENLANQHQELQIKYDNAPIKTPDDFEAFDQTIQTMFKEQVSQKKLELEWLYQQALQNLPNNSTSPTKQNSTPHNSAFWHSPVRNTL